MEIEPEKFRLQYKIPKIFKVGGKNYGRSGFRKQHFFRPYFTAYFPFASRTCNYTLHLSSELITNKLHKFIKLQHLLVKLKFLQPLLPLLERLFAARCRCDIIPKRAAAVAEMSTKVLNIGCNLLNLCTLLATGFKLPPQRLHRFQSVEQLPVHVRQTDINSFNRWLLKTFFFSCCEDDASWLTVKSCLPNVCTYLRVNHWLLFVVTESDSIYYREGLLMDFLVSCKFMTVTRSELSQKYLLSIDRWEISVQSSFLCISYHIICHISYCYTSDRNVRL